MPTPADFIVTVIKGMIRIGDFLMGIFELLHHSQNELTTYSRVGEAPIEKENREWRERIIARWYWFVGILAVLAGLVMWAW